MCNLKDQNITMYFLELNIKIPFLVGVSLGGRSGWLGLVVVVAWCGWSDGLDGLDGRGGRAVRGGRGGPDGRGVRGDWGFPEV